MATDQDGEDLLDFLESLKELAEFYGFDCNQLLGSMLEILWERALQWYQVKRGDIHNWFDFKGESIWLLGGISIDHVLDLTKPETYGRYDIVVTINGKPVRGLIDTGAKLTYIGRTLRELLESKGLHAGVEERAIKLVMERVPPNSKHIFLMCLSRKRPSLVMYP